MPKIDSTQMTELTGISQAKPVKVIAITAGKGGVGKSNIAVNLAIGLAQKQKSVLLLDADLGLANIDIMLGLQARYNLSHVIEGSRQLNEIILEGPHGIRVVPAASGVEYMTQLSLAQHAGIINAFNELPGDIDYMIIDTAAGISDTALSFTRSSQEVVVVVCDEPTSITDAYAFIKVMCKRFEWKHFHILASMVRGAREGPDLFNKLYRVAEQFLEVRLNYLGAIPYDERVREAIKKQKPVLSIYPECSAAQAMRQVVNALEALPRHVLGGNTSFFLERMIVGNTNRSFESPGD